MSFEAALPAIWFGLIAWFLINSTSWMIGNRQKLREHRVETGEPKPTSKFDGVPSHEEYQRIQNELPFARWDE